MKTVCKNRFRPQVFRVACGEAWVCFMKLENLMIFSLLIVRHIFLPKNGNTLE